MRPAAGACAIAILTLSSLYPTVRAAGVYPVTLVADAKAVDGVTTVTSKITITIDRLIETSRRDRLINGLKQNGYQGFMNVLWTLPAIGSIATQNAKVDVQYAWETETKNGRHLIIGANKPLFFLSSVTGGSGKPRAGYDLTYVELLFDGHGGAKGTLSGAARIKPSPEEGIILQDYAVDPVQLTVTPK